MKEKIYTIPVTDAFQSDDECPFCYVERTLEEHALDFVLSPSTASYMESDIREATDAAGFCKMHYKKMFDYGNRLGAGLILKTHFKKLNQELEEQIRKHHPGHASFLDKFKKGTSDHRSALGAWTIEKEQSCYICNFYKKSFDRYIDTFFEMYKKDQELQNVFARSKGCCLPHFGILVDASEQKLSGSEKTAFLDTLFDLQKRNMERLYNDLDWFCDKFDYRNKDADWKTSKDAIQRGMQKAAGGYPALPPHTSAR